MKPDHDAPFGEHLRALREAAGLTQEELASRSGMTAKAVGALERGERKRPYPHTVRSLADALELDDDGRSSLLASVPKRSAEARAVPAVAPEPQLPVPRTPLLGRERELEELEVFLRQSRLLTLTGTGGVGKTRLALEAARRVAGLFPDGAAFVALAPLSDPALVIPTVARSLGSREAEYQAPLEFLRSYLREKRMLLVLDNFEHLMEAAPEVSALLEGGPGLTVLVTSRAPLRVRGEQEYPVPPLALPASTLSPDPGEVAGSPSGSLFFERARAASPAFEITDHNASAVASICWRLDGLPLALELAAAKTRFLSPAALLVRLDQALSAGWARDLPERQRTMQATLDWSHDLLQAPHKELFGRLSVFAGGFTLEAAEEVCAFGQIEAVDVLELLGGLVEQSLVTARAGADGVRYGMLEPVRQYALEKLEESGEAEETGQRHAAFFLALAERGGPELRGHDQAAWLGRLETELGNLRAALSWSVEHGRAEEIARMAWTSWTYWWLSGHISEGSRWMDEALASDPDASPTTRARLLTISATLGQALGDFETTRTKNDQSMQIFREFGDDDGLYFAMGTGGLIALGQGQPELGRTLMEKSAEERLKMGDKWASGAMFGFSATVALGQGDLTNARRLAEKSLSLGREIGSREVISVALPTMATIAGSDGDHERAARLFEEGLTLSAEVGEWTNVAYYLERLAEISVINGDLARGARLAGAAEALLETIEVIAYPHATDRSLYERQLAAARESLGPQAWAEAREEGRSMTAEEAVAYALEDRRPSQRPQL